MKISSFHNYPFPVQEKYVQLQPSVYHIFWLLMISPKTLILGLVTTCLRPGGLWPCETTSQPLSFIASQQLNCTPKVIQLSYRRLVEVGLRLRGIFTASFLVLKEEEKNLEFKKCTGHFFCFSVVFSLKYQVSVSLVLD